MFKISSSQSLVAVASAGALALLSACGGAETAQPGELTGQVQVFAAASLNSAGAELEKTFEEENPGVDVSFNYAGSSLLVQQMEQGAAPDLLITADTATMDGATAAVPDLADAPVQTLATNRLVLVTATGNPADIHSVQDLGRQDVTVALCAAEVPCGNLAQQELDQQGVQLTGATEEQNVSEVATKVATGAVDAGFIYSTDSAALQTSQDVTEIALPDLESNVYPLAVTASGQQNEAASAFSRWLSEEEAQRILADFGFGSPSSAE